MNMFRALWLSIKDAFDELILLWICNFLWFLFNGPFLLLALLLLNGGMLIESALIVLLGAVPFALANAGMYSVTQRIVEARKTSWRAFFEGIRTYWSLSIRLYALWVVGLVTIIVNIRFYMGLQSTVGFVLVVAFFYILLVWFAMLIYIGPLMVIQLDKRIRLILRNAFFMTFGRPIFTLVTLLLMGVVSYLSVLIWILPVLLTFSLLALWGFRATAMIIEDFEARRLAEAEKTALPTDERPEKGRGGQVRPRQ